MDVVTPKPGGGFYSERGHFRYNAVEVADMKPKNDWVLVLADANPFSVRNGFEA